MATKKPLIGIPVDAVDVGGRPFHGVGEKYVNAVAHGSAAIPLLVPAFGAGVELDPLEETLDLEEVLDELDGLFLTGSPSNVEPHHYEGAPSAPGTLHDPQRDVTTLPLITLALDRNLPILAVCRGCQELNVALGGTLHQRVHEVEGLLDHREVVGKPREERYGPAHPVKLAAGGLLQRLLGRDEIEVNSLHTQGVDRLAPDLRAEATAPDGLVEAMSHKDPSRFVLAVQWHPEWRYQENPVSRAIFRVFGEAARSYATAAAA